MEAITIKDGLKNMDFEKVTNMLTNTFWCKRIKIGEVIEDAQNSALVVGGFSDNLKQIDYAGVVSDKTRFAYILGVYVGENFRRKGIGQKMINHILAHEEFKDLYQWLLITKDVMLFIVK